MWLHSSCTNGWYLSFVNMFKNHTSFIIGPGNSFLNDMWKSNLSLGAVFPSIYNVFLMIEFVFGEALWFWDGHIQMERWWMLRLQLDRVSFFPRKLQCILVLVLAAWRNYLFIEESLYPSFLERHPKQQGVWWKNGAPLKVATSWFMVISDNIDIQSHEG